MSNLPKRPPQNSNLTFGQYRAVRFAKFLIKVAAFVILTLGIGIFLVAIFK